MNQANRVLLLALVTFLLLAVLLAAAGSGPAPAPLRPAAPAPLDAPASRADGLTAEQVATLASLQKVDGYPLYTMRYYGDLPAAMSDSRPGLPAAGPAAAPRPAWACSLFAALGDADNRLFGRNFDWRFSPALLLWTEPPDGYASVSMVDLEYFGMTDRTSGRVLVDPVDLPLAERRGLLETPAMPFDGMNAAGVAVGMAAVPQADERHDPGKATIGEIGVIREILDHAGSVDEAASILKQYNINWEGGPTIHYMVADRSGRAALVEFQGGEIVVMPENAGWHAATNFVRSAVPGDATGQCPRHDALVRRLSSASGVLTTGAARDLLKSVAQQTGSQTQWSVVYNMSQGQVEIVMGRQYDQVHTFGLARSPGP